MPEFILDSAGEVTVPGNAVLPPVALEFADLDAFTQGFIECGFFLSECPQVSTEEFLTDEHQEDMREGAADGTLPCDVGFSDLQPASLQKIIDLCCDFQSKAADLLEAAYERGYTPEQAGRDYWFTHTGAGVGFWDRDELDADHSAFGSPRVGETGWDAYAEAREESLGRKLSKAAGRGEFYLEFNPDGEGGGTVYFEGY